jgi:putative spermidine/putrescine transport system permease protein
MKSREIASSSAARTPGRLSPLRRESLVGFLLVLPPIAVLVLLVVYPALDALRFSLGFVPTDNPSYASGLDLIRSSSPTLEVFQKLFSSSFFSGNLALTLRVSFVSVVLLVLLSYPLALYTRFGHGKLAEAARVLYLLPMFVPVVIATYALITFFGDNGWLEAILGVFKIPYHSIIRQEAGIVLGHVWVGIPFAVLMISSGLESVSNETLEAARDQGASAWVLFWRIILPLNIVPLLIVMTFAFIGVFGSYTVPYMLGPSAPQMLGVSMALNFGAFRQPQQAVAMAVISFMVCAIAGSIYVWATTRNRRA